MKDFLLQNGFSNDIWMKKEWFDIETGYNFVLSIEPISGWSTLSQETQGFTVYEINKLNDIKPTDKFIMAYNQIALLPFQSIDDIKQFWLLLTHTELF